MALTKLQQKRLRRIDELLEDTRCTLKNVDGMYSAGFNAGRIQALGMKADESGVSGKAYEKGAKELQRIVDLRKRQIERVRVVLAKELSRG